MKHALKHVLALARSVPALLCLFFGASTLAHAQGASYTGTPIALTRGGFPAAGATVTVCLGAVSVTFTASPPCAPYASIYSDAALSVPITQPGFTTDGLGNYPFYVAPGLTYTIVITGSGFTPYSTTWAAPVISGDATALTAASVKLKEGSAASGAAGYDVIYGNSGSHRACAKLNNGSEDCLVTDALAATLSNKTLTAPVVNGTPSGTGIATITAKSGTGGGDYTTASASYTDVDATNLALTVTVPVGWKLIATATGICGQATAITGIFIGIFDSVSATTASSLDPVPAGTGSNLPFSTQRVITGDGMSHTVKLRYATANIADSAIIVNSTISGVPVIPQMVFTLQPSN